MAAKQPKKRLDSAFADLGFKKTVAAHIEEVRRLYLEDEVPWVVGYSGGKDSTAVLSLVWAALEGIEPDKRTKPVHVISTDTLVESPVVAMWVDGSLAMMRAAAEKSNLPIQAHKLTPKVSDTFWVNLIGKGYPAPRHKFRWCTERMKINPSNEFILRVVRESGEAILVLGTRKAESTKRASTMEKHEKQRTRERLSPNSRLPNSLIYSPIEDWNNDDVWTFLMQRRNPWGYSNKDLLNMYMGASADAECPLVVDESTPSCGDSRFGCWVCTLVEKDKSMEAMIQNDEEKEWMLPLLELRNKLDVHDDKPLRDFRRMSGNVQLFHNEPIHGPYKQDARENWLRELLKAQQWIRKNGPKHVRDIELISQDELLEIRRIWVVEKHEIEDLLPKVFLEVTGEPFPVAIDDSLPFGQAEMGLLLELCGEDRLHYELVRELLDVERRSQALNKRTGLYENLESAFKKAFYEDRDDAVEFARRRKAGSDDVKEKKEKARKGGAEPEKQKQAALSFEKKGKGK